MKQLGTIFSSVFGGGRLDAESAQRKQIYRDWERERRNALNHSDLAEIDAIFSRAL